MGLMNEWMVTRIWMKMFLGDHLEMKGMILMVVVLVLSHFSYPCKEF